MNIHPKAFREGESVFVVDGYIVGGLDALAAAKATGQKTIHTYVVQRPDGSTLEEFIEELRTLKDDPTPKRGTVWRTRA